MHIKSLLRYLSGRNVYYSVPIYNLNWVRSKKLFRELLGDSIITLVDVGARGGDAVQQARSAEELMPLESHFGIHPLELGKLPFHFFQTLQI